MRHSVCLLGLVLAGAVCQAQTPARTQEPDQSPNRPANRNDPAEVEKFRDRGFGLFIHWGVDGPLAGVISHSLVGASPDFTERFFKTLPGYFNPERYEPAKWASLAKLAGFEYVMFTTKHHAGFCMWDTATTDFGVMHTPYGKDITRQLVD
ncbi:MAG TPA: alpha-L-fucosidase, partial [Bryobacteraceae bacterium]